MTELKPCPFCGSKNIKVDSVEISCPQEIGSYAECLDCKSTIEVTKPHKVIDAWNTRPIEDALQAEIERLNTVLNEWYMAWITDCITPQANGNEAFGLDEGLVLCARMMKPILEETRLLLGKTESPDGL